MSSTSQSSVPASSPTSSRYQEIRRVLWIVLVLNFTVSTTKLLFGYLAGSVSMIADGFHSLSDGSSNIIGLIGVRVANQPIDADHPYGHSKFETLSSLAIAAMLFFVSIEILKTTWQRWQQPVSPEVGVLQFVVILTTMIINLLVQRYERSQGQRLSSDILLSDAAHTLTDFYVSCSVLISLIAVRAGFPAMDLLASIAIAIIIVKTGFEIVANSSRVLCDAAVLEPSAVESAVLKMPRVVSCNKIRTRGRDDQVYLDIHVQVVGQLTLEQVHDLSHDIDLHLRKYFPNIHESSVHIEPAKIKAKLI